MEKKKTMFKRGDALRLGNGNVGVIYSAEQNENNIGLYLVGVPFEDGVSYFEMTDEEILMNGFSKVGCAVYVH